MTNYYWNDWYMGWGWVLWFGVIFLFFSGIGNWGYTYSAHQKYNNKYSGQTALDILNERYARGELKHEDYDRMKGALTPSNRNDSLKTA